MLIDWFTVVAQAANFLILVWLLARYLYRPVLRAIESREKERESQVQALTSEKSRLETERAAVSEQARKLDTERTAMLDCARAEAAATRDRLLHEAAEEAARMRSSQLQSVAADVAKAQREFCDLLRAEVMSCIRKVIADLADEDMEHAVLAVFLRRLRDSKQPGSAEDPGMPSDIRLRSTFALREADRLVMEKEVHALFCTKAPVVYEVSPGLGLGLELSIQHRKIAWKLDDYLDSMQARLIAEVQGWTTQINPA